jgi:hypothetical protein
MFSLKKYNCCIYSVLPMYQNDTSLTQLVTLMAGPSKGIQRLFCFIESSRQHMLQGTHEVNMSDTKIFPTFVARIVC